MTAGLYSDAVYSALRGGLEFVQAARVVTAAGLPVATLDLLGGSVTMDEEWSPYVQASLTAVDPGMLIDPRLAYRLIIDAGYVYPSGVRDVRQLANLFITAAQVDLRTRVLSLTAQSDEVLPQQGAHWGVDDDVQTYPSHAAALTNFLERAQTGLGLPTIVNGLGASTSASMTGYVIRSGDAWWSHIESVRDMAGAEVYCDETRTWRLAPYTFDESPSIEGYLTTGDAHSSWPNPTDAAFALPILIEADEALDRDEWANAVVLVHTWPGEGGTTNRVARIRAVPSGPYAPTSVGYRVSKQTRTTPITDTEADAACNAILYRTQRRGIRHTFTARAAYWLRPRRLHRCWLSGTDIYARITRVTWQLDGTGLMTINTRAPEPEGGEA